MFSHELLQNLLLEAGAHGVWDAITTLYQTRQSKEQTSMRHASLPAGSLGRGGRGITRSRRWRPAADRGCRQPAGPAIPGYVQGLWQACSWCTRARAALRPKFHAGEHGAARRVCVRPLSSGHAAPPGRSPAPPHTLPDLPDQAGLRTRADLNERRQRAELREMSRTVAMQIEGSAEAASHALRRHACGA